MFNGDNRQTSGLESEREIGQAVVHFAKLAPLELDDRQAQTSEIDQDGGKAGRGFPDDDLQAE